MADTYRWLRACEPGSGYELAEPYRRNLKENVKGFALDTLFGQALVSLLRGRPGHAWEGTAAGLHADLKSSWEDACGYRQKEMDRYPGSARVISGLLNQHGASLRENGIVIDRDRASGKDRSKLIRSRVDEVPVVAQHLVDGVRPRLGQHLGIDRHRDQFLQPPLALRDITLRGLCRACQGRRQPVRQGQYVGENGLKDAPRHDNHAFPGPFWKEDLR
jgi:hypothetical protein